MSGKNNGNNNASSGWQSIPNSAVTGPSGGQMNFMASYGLQPTIDGFTESSAIINAFKQADYAASQQSGKSNGSSGQSNKK
jgi:hypothetical protein